MTQGTLNRGLLGMLLILSLWAVAAISPESQQGDRRRLQERVKEIERLVQEFVQAGGKPERVAPLGKKMADYIRAGKTQEAEAVMDQILEIVKGQKEGAREARSGGVRVKVYDSLGDPIPKSELEVKHTDPGVVLGAFVMDAEYEPIPFGVASYEDGAFTLSSRVPTPFILHFSPRVKGFGQVKVYADNGGKGYTQPSRRTSWEIDLPLEATKSRIAKTRELVKSYSAGVFREETLNYLSSAEKSLARATAERDLNAGELYRALSDALWAGELATLDVARKKIAENGRRPNFKFGFFTEGYESWPEPLKESVASVFNFATIPTFFLSAYERSRGRPQHDSTEKTLEWLEAAGIEAKGHPLVYLMELAVPTWLRGKDYSTLSDAFRTRSRREVGRFKGRIKAWDIINEAHNPNKHYTQDEVVKLTDVAARVTKQADSEAVRIINVTSATGDYAAAPGFDGMVRDGMAQTPISYLKAVEEAGVDYDVIGVQLYYPALDMMEISRIIDRYAKLGKPIHITELGVSSATGPDRKSNFYKTEDFSKLLGEWHRPWDEQTQADWIEQFYTIAYSKTSVEAITYTHITDQFWPFGGLYRRDFVAKPSFGRLKRLIESFQSGKPAQRTRR